MSKQLRQIKSEITTLEILISIETKVCQKHIDKIGTMHQQLKALKVTQLKLFFKNIF